MFQNTKTTLRPEKPESFTRILSFHFILAIFLLLSLTGTSRAMPIEKGGTTAPRWSDTHPLHVVLLVSNKQNPFWQMVETAAVKAASDLQIKLQVIDINGNPLRPVRVLSSLVNSSHKPDAVLFPNIKNTGKAVLELLEKHKIYSVIYDNGFSPKDNMGNPGQYYRYWLGEVEVNNYEASRQLTREVIESALKRFPNHRPLPMVVFDGGSSSRASAQRLLGMFDALVDYKEQVEIRQIFRTRYNPSHAYTATISATQRYPEIRVIWSANDAMALRSIEALKELNKSPGQDILVTGFDLLPEARKKIEQKELFNSYGGHFMAAAWGLVYLHDQLKAQTPDYRKLMIPLFSGADQFKVMIPYNGGERWIDPGKDFSAIDFTLYSHNIHPKSSSDPQPKYLFEAGNNQ